jgi:hypothetical protein
MVDGQCHALATLPSAKGLEVKGGWMGLLAGLDESRKSLPHWVSNSGLYPSHRTDYVFPASGRTYLENLGIDAATYMNTVFK